MWEWRHKNANPEDVASPTRSCEAEAKVAAGDGWVRIEGGHYMLIPYGAERDDAGRLWCESSCHLCGAAVGTFHSSDCPMGPGPRELAETCRDCGVSQGRLHVINCGIEQCPRCGGQYMSCSCNSSEDRTVFADRIHNWFSSNLQRALNRKD
jgi:hypothetical protein